MRPVALCLAAVLLTAAAVPPPLRGFTEEGAAAERAAESVFLDVPSAQGALDHAAAIAAHPHYAGTPADRALAEYARDRLTEFGFEARIEPFRTVVDTPRKLALELYPDGRSYVPATGLHRARGTPPIGFDLREAGDPVDPPTLDPAVGLPFNAGSADGDVTAPLVYAGRGLASDFAMLRRRGVDVHGAVALVRYGGAFRGILARNAQDAGAAGVILYNDPADDGARRGPTYPNGPWRPLQSIQRGSLGEGIRIPVLPVSATTAQTLMRSLRGDRVPVPNVWNGGLDAPYVVGRGPGVVHLVVAMNRVETTLWNTIGVLRGSAPGFVMLGAHRDAWVAGVGDNGAGVAVLLEAARGLGFLARGGRAPRRSIVIALWDGEEIGLRGSAAYARAHADELRRGCVAYVNADENITGGRFGADAVGALDAAIVDASHAVPDPQRPAQSIYDRWHEQPSHDVRAIGGGSDHESFLFAFGTPVAELGFSGPFGPYHSSYDTLRYATAWSDPGFALHRTTAQLYGVLALRLANAPTPPYGFAAYAAAMRAGEEQLTVRAARDGGRFAPDTFAPQIAAFEAAARNADARIARGDGLPADRALAVAQSLDLLLYGVDGYAAVPYPRVARAFARGGNEAAATIEEARAAIDAATRALQ